MNEPRAEFWEKDGLWHITKKHVPTFDDRCKYPASYPPYHPGPFFVWINEAFRTEEEALAAINKGELK